LTLPRKGYVSISLPTELVNAIRDRINAPDSLYRSVAEFVKDSAREKLTLQTPFSHTKATYARRRHHLSTHDRNV
jgi:Arc/MetJ-type ribon-helix-helix transcriptional regulator